MIAFCQWQFRMFLYGTMQAVVINYRIVNNQFAAIIGGQVKSIYAVLGYLYNPSNQTKCFLPLPCADIYR